MLVELTGTGSDVTATVFENGKPVRAVTASKGAMAEGLELAAELLRLNGDGILGPLTEQELQPEIRSGIHGTGIELPHGVDGRLRKAQNLPGDEDLRPSGVLRIVHNLTGNRRSASS